MGLIRVVAGRVRSGAVGHLGRIDAAVAAALTAGALVALDHLHYRGPAVLAAVGSVATMGAVGLRRKVPQAALIVAVTAVTVYQSITRDPQGAFGAAALVLVGYGFGRSALRTARYGRAATILVYALAIFEIGLCPSHQSTVAGTAGTWVTLVLLPTAVGAAVGRQRAGCQAAGRGGWPTAGRAADPGRASGGRGAQPGGPGAA